MRRLALLTAVLAALLAPAPALSGSAAAASSAPAAPVLVAFHGHFGGFHLGGGGLGRRSFGFFGGRRRTSRGLLRRAAHALVFAYFLHLFFSHGGLSILLWLALIGLVLHFVRRRRRLSY